MNLTRYCTSSVSVGGVSVFASASTLNSVGDTSAPFVYALPREPFVDNAFTTNESATASVISSVSPAFTILKIGITIVFSAVATSASVAETISAIARLRKALVAVISPVLPEYFL